MPDVPQRKIRKPGCITIAFVLGLAALGGGGWLMSHWDQLGGFGKSGAIMLTVFGSILILPLILIGVVFVVIKYFFHRLGKELNKGAGSIIANTKAMYDRIHEFRDATDADFAKVDRSAYDQATEDLNRATFRHLGDIVDSTIEETGGNSPPIRVFASPDGTTTAGVYHFKAPGMEEKLGPDGALICDFSSEFSDDSFLMTSNTEGLDLMTPPPKIRRRHCHVQTPLDEIRTTHETEKQKLLAAQPGIQCKSVSTLDDVIAAAKRQQAIKNAFRKNIGFVDPEEIKRIASKMGGDAKDVGEMTAKAVDEQRKPEQSDDA
ncbi:MAG TPA: hypothetical protein VH518_11570 [Tepidisphaeraceae bacterium]|jgi:hypothetical protein